MALDRISYLLIHFDLKGKPLPKSIMVSELVSPRKSAVEHKQDSVSKQKSIERTGEKLGHGMLLFSPPDSEFRARTCSLFGYSSGLLVVPFAEIFIFFSS